MSELRMPKVIYIAGYGRSGSTLLDCILARKSATFGGGELTNIFREWLDDRPCSCGESLRSCVFWSPILQDADAARLSTPLARATRRAERLFFPVVTDEYLSVWRQILGTLPHRWRIDFLVDSSKISRLSYRRPLRLRELGCEISLVHLVRRPEGVISSLRKGSNRALEAGEKSIFREYWLRGVLGWFVANYLVERLVRKHGFKRCVVRYEDLVGEPDVELGRIADLTGAEALNSPDVEAGTDHGVSGNRMRRQGGRQEMDASGRVDHQYSMPQRVLIALMHAWGRTHGYWPAQSWKAGVSMR